LQVALLPVFTSADCGIAKTMPEPPDKRTAIRLAPL
jgi:hypothetical protein